jgi:hypothetical protein
MNPRKFSIIDFPNISIDPLLESQGLFESCDLDYSKCISDFNILFGHNHSFRLKRSIIKELFEFATQNSILNEEVYAFLFCGYFDGTYIDLRVRAITYNLSSPPHNRTLKVNVYTSPILYSKKTTSDAIRDLVWTKNKNKIDEIDNSQKKWKIQRDVVLNGATPLSEQGYVGSVIGKKRFYDLINDKFPKSMETIIDFAYDSKSHTIFLVFNINHTLSTLAPNTYVQLPCPPNKPCDTDNSNAS